MNSNKKICVIGLGYIGLPTSALLANKGYKVHGVDIVQSTVDTINRGKIHIIEPELDTFVQSAVKSGNLIASTKPDFADIFILAVPTPFYKNSDEYVPNIDYVISATKSIVPFIKEGNIVILESTSPIGTTHKIQEILEESLSQKDIDTSKIYISHCPERVLPGHIMRELVQNDRIIGGITPEATTKTIEFYQTFVDGKVLSTDAKTAEMAKLTENSFRDVNIAFANELSILCDKFDIDVWELIKLTNRHPRVNVLQPGAGVGGHCIAVDPWFIVHSAKQSGIEANLIQSAREVNNYKTEWAIQKIKNQALEYELKNNKKPSITIFGLSFKPDIDDLRESPALYIAQTLKSELANFTCVEPNIDINHFDDMRLVCLEEALKSDIKVFLVAHKEFRGLSLDINDDILDFCGVLQ